MDFKTVKSDETISPDFLGEYKKGMSFFYSQLVDLNINIFIINHIRRFPFHVFCAKNDTIFFLMVLKNFFDISVLTITRLLTDSGGELYTLPRFKNMVRKSIKPEYADAFSKQLKNAKFDTGVKKLLEKSKKLRNERIAHLKRKTLNKTINFNFIELENLRDALNNLLDTLSFEVEYLMLPIPYSEKVQHPAGTDSRPDIEKILDQIAFSSIKLNMPEKSPKMWDRMKRRIKLQDLNIINTYRKKMGLVEA